MQTYAVRFNCGSEGRLFDQSVGPNPLIVGIFVEMQEQQVCRVILHTREKVGVALTPQSAAGGGEIAQHLKFEYAHLLE